MGTDRPSAGQSPGFAELGGSADGGFSVLPVRAPVSGAPTVSVCAKNLAWQGSTRWNTGGSLACPFPTCPLVPQLPLSLKAASNLATARDRDRKAAGP